MNKYKFSVDKRFIVLGVVALSLLSSVLGSTRLSFPFNLILLASSGWLHISFLWTKIQDWGIDIQELLKSVGKKKI